MGDSIAHRGPDGEGFLMRSPGGELRMTRSPEAPAVGPATIGFAHRRLAIIDLSADNDQPLLDSTGECALLYNGEIYNYVELRSELEALGHEFRTDGDTEALLAAYREWGEDCLERLVGMWAFALLDTRRNSLFLARDRFGIKPLYYWVGDGELYFASEIKALLTVPAVPREPDQAVLRRFLLSGAVDDSDATFFSGIRSLPAAHAATVPLDEGPAGMRVHRYWSPPPEGFDGSIADAARRFAELFASAVSTHVRSDVPVGTCLSGGLDSSSIVCVANRLQARGEIPSYAHHGFGYLPDDPQYSERGFMQQVVDATGLEMTYVEVPPEHFERALVEISRLQDEPFPSTSIAAQWFVFNEAHASGLKVMLDGQGADEVLGGYHHYFPLIAAAMLRSRRFVPFARLVRQHRRAYGRAPISRRAALANLAPDRAREAAPAALVEPPAAALLREPVRSAGEDEPALPPEYDSVHELLADFTGKRGLPALLRFEDRNSMAHSIEARVPFLDHRLVEFAFRLPGEFKVRGVDTKAILREAMRGVLPEPIRTRKDKIGFRAEPSATWALAERHRDSLLGNRTEHEEQWFDAGAVASLLDGRSRGTDEEFMLWRVINAKLWLRTFWADADADLD